MNAQSLSHVQLFVTAWNVTHKSPLSMGFPRQEYWSGLPCSRPRDLPDLGIKPTSPALAGGFFTTEPSGKPSLDITVVYTFVMALERHFHRFWMFWQGCSKDEYPSLPFSASPVPVVYIQIKCSHIPYTYELNCMFTGTAEQYKKLCRPPLRAVLNGQFIPAGGCL